MKSLSRRKFIKSTGTVAGGLTITTNNVVGKILEKTSTCENPNKDILVGIITMADNPEEDLRIVTNLGFETCQLRMRNHIYSSELAKRLSSALKKYKLKPSSLSTSGPGPCKYNFLDGPSLCGLVPREHRAVRIDRLMQAIDFCKAAGIPSLISHFGYIPENPKDVLYLEFIDIMKSITEYALRQDIIICFESGTETPVTTLRAIQDVGTGNLFVNYDTANLVMYGKSNPLDGLKVIGKYVKSLHAKDGTYPTNPYQLGKEVPIPTGEVDFSVIIPYLKKLNFKGNIIIENETPQKSDEYFIQTKKYLEKFI